MLSYDKTTNMLTLRKVSNPESSSHFDMLKDIKDAFNVFVNETVYDALETINTRMQDIAPGARKIIFYPEVASGYRNEENHVRIRGYVEGFNRNTSTRIIDLPYMDNLGKLHFWDGSVKNLLNRLVSSDDVSYDMNKHTLSLVLSKKTVKIHVKGTKYDVQISGRDSRSLPLGQLAMMIGHLDGRDIDVHNLIHNPLLQESLYNFESLQSPLIAATWHQLIPADTDAAEGKSTLLIKNLRESADYKVESIRDALNSAVSLDRALGEVLSRPVLNYEAGTYVTPAVLSDIKRNKINCIHVKTVVPNPKMKITGGVDGQSLQYTVIMEGWPVTDFLRLKFPWLKDYDVVPKTFRIPEGGWDFSATKDMAVFTSGSEAVYATKEVLEFLASTGVKGVLLGAKQTPYYFETEILGNYTLRYSDAYSLAECQSMGVSPYEWFCYLDDNTSADYRRERLYGEDLVALLSAIGYVVLRNRNIFMDRDRDFLKKVELADVALPRALVYAINSHMQNYRAQVRSYVLMGETRKGGHDVFDELTRQFKRELENLKLLETCDTTNFVAEISQATLVANRLKEPPEVMRQIASPYYGRLCPFETPEGKQVGMVNHTALSCHIENGNLLVRVRKVLKHGDRISISDVVEEMPVRKEIRYRLSDVLQLVPDKEEGYYKNTRVIAKVPNPNIEGDRQVFADIMACDLDYVYAHTEGFMSATASFIPFACSDDAVRITFGSKMIKSAIYLLDPDKPLVQTFMYRDIFDSSDAYLIRAKKAGVVIDVGLNMLTVMYDGDSDETNYRLDEFKVTNDSVVFMRYKVSVGNRFKAGQILADCSASREGVYCPGKNELVAYMPTGWNYEDAVHVSDRASIDFISIGSNTVKKKRYKESSIDRSGMYMYYTNGDKLTAITTQRGNDKEMDTVTTKYSGIWYNTFEDDSKGMPVYCMDLLGYNKLRVGDKMSGRHGNKGVDAIVDNNSDMPMLANGTPIRMLLNPLGIPSRMNTGQVFEAHLGLVAHVLGIYINSDPFNGASLEEVQNLMRMTCELANCGNAQAGSTIARKYGMPADLCEKIDTRMPQIMEWAGTFDENGDAKLYNPVTGKWFPFPVTIGVSTMLKMKQEGETKLHGRAGLLEENYEMVSGQPTEGGEGGGQATGEMELWAYAAYGASDTLYEICNGKSDNEVDRVNRMLEALGQGTRMPDSFSAPRSLTSFMYQLEAFGLKLTDDEGLLPDIRANISERRFHYEICRLIAEDVLYTNYLESDAQDQVTEDQVDAVFHSLFG